MPRREASGSTPSRSVGWRRSAPIGAARWRVLRLLIIVPALVALAFIAMWLGAGQRLTLTGLAAFLVVWAGTFLWQVPRWQAEQRSDDLTPKELFEVENSARSTLGSLLGTATLLAGLFFAWQQLGSTNQTLHLGEEGQITERFTRAVDQLGSDQVSVRLGGIYGLERIAGDSERDAWTVMAVLSAYVRGAVPWPVMDSTPAQGEPETVPVEVQAIIDVIARRPADMVFDRCVDLSSAYLAGIVVTYGNLTNLCLDGSNLTGANLQESILDGSDLSRAILLDATLSHASLRGTNLTSANLARANLDSVDFSQARL